MENKHEKLQETSEKAQRKPYTKPVCHSEPIFEVTALACGKVPGQSAACNTTPSAS